MGNDGVKETLEQLGDTTKIAIYLSLREKIWNVILMAFVALCLISPLSFIVGIALGNNLIIAPLAIIGSILALIFLYKNYSLKSAVSFASGEILQIQQTGWRKQPISIKKSPRDAVVLQRRYGVGFSNVRWKISGAYNSAAIQEGYNNSLHIAEEILDKKIGFHSPAAIAREVWDKRKTLMHEEFVLSNYKCLVPRKDYALEEQLLIKKIDSWLRKNRMVTMTIGSAIWEILYLPSNEDPLLLFASPIPDPNFIPLNNFAENISEQLSIPLIDHTGAFPELIEASETDISLKDRISKEMKIQKKNYESLSEVDSITISDENQILKIESNYPPLEWQAIFFVIFFGSLILIFGLFILLFGNLAAINTENVSFGEGIFYVVLISILGFSSTYLGYYLINGLKTSWIVKVTDGFASHKNKKLISRSTIKIPFDKIERAYEFEKGFGFGVELISDSKRITIDSALNLNQAIQLKSMLVNRVTK